jgi:hypothetical protein
MPLQLRKLFRYLRDILAREAIPVWLSLVLMATGAALAYYIAPIINGKFEAQAAKREFIVKNLQEFSSDTKTLIDVVHKSLTQTSQSSYQDYVRSAAPTIAKLQFSSTQLFYIAPDDHDAILKFQKALDSLQDELIDHKVSDDGERIVEGAKTLMKQSLTIYEILLSKAGMGSRISRAN